MGNDDSNPSSFFFRYSPSSIKDCILDTEVQIRRVIEIVLIRKHGIFWYTNPLIGFTEKEQEILKKRINDEENKFSNQSLSNNLIDYCYILDLRNIIQKNWQSFSHIFLSKEKTLLMLDMISNIRNPIMHGRNSVLPHQQYLCLGLCGELLLSILRWNKGYKNRVKIYECDLKFGVLQNDTNTEENAKIDSIKIAKQWINNLEKKLSNYSISNDIDKNNWLFRFPEGHTKVSLGNSTWHADYDRRTYWYSTVKISSTNIQSLDRLLEAGQHPYWIYTMILNENLDLSLIKSNTEKSLGQIDWRIGGRYSDGELVPHSIDEVIHRFNDMEIHVKVYSSLDASGSTIQIICNAPPTKGFFRAHTLLEIKTILSILNGEMTPVHKHNLILRTCTNN